MGNFRIEDLIERYIDLRDKYDALVIMAQVKDDRICQLNEQIDEYKMKEEEAYNCSKENYKNIAHDLGEANEKIARYKVSEIEYETKILNLEQELEEQKRKYTQLQSENAVNFLTGQDIEADLCDAKEYAETLEEEIKSLEFENEELTMTVNALEADKDRLEIENKELQFQLEETRRDADLALSMDWED